MYPSNASMRPAVQEALSRLNAAGIGVDSVSGGGTGAALQAHELPELTELRVGTYVFNDWNTVSAGWASEEDCAMTTDERPQYPGQRQQNAGNGPGERGTWTYCRISRSAHL